MMNPFVAFSLAANIICFIDAVTDIILRLPLQYYDETLEREPKTRTIAYDLHSLYDKAASTKDFSEDNRTIQELC